MKIVNRVHLTNEELASIYNKDFGNERLNMVKDVFLFSCYTGLAYADVKKLTANNITTGIDGEKWIFTRRQKTDSSSHIPILPLAQQCH
jgi:hypothetical protein